MKVPYFKNKLKQEYANKYFDYKAHGACGIAYRKLDEEYKNLGLSTMARQAVEIRYHNLIRRKII